MDDIAFALVLNLHQPAGNLDELLASDPWAACEILYAIDRIPRSLWPYEDTGRVHLSLSGTLLETLADPGFQQRAYGIVDCGSLLWYLQNTRIIDILGTGYYHPVLPLIPPADWPAQLSLWQHTGQHLFARRGFAGFWPPEMGFAMELIPLIRRLGYRYVLADSAHVEPLTPMSWHELRYQPHVARHHGTGITVIVRDRELSDAQESGMDPGWFISEAQARTRDCDFTPLVTTCTDGDNGGWFRNTTPGAAFWTAFYQPLLERARAGEAGGIRPVFIHEHLAAHPARGEVRIRPGAWNTGWHDGSGFTQWTGSAAQQEALARIWAVSRQLHAAAASAGHPLAGQAYRHLLRAQTSCNLYWGQDWVPRCHTDLDHSLALPSSAATSRQAARRAR